MAQKESILMRIRRQREIWGLIYIIILILSTYFVFTIPVPAEPMVESAYSVIDSYGRGSPNYGKPIIVNHCETYTDVLPLGAAVEAFWNHVKARDVHVIVFAAGSGGIDMGQTRICDDEMKKAWQGLPNIPEYGKSVVYLGWCVPATLMPVWEDIWGAFGERDYYGKKLADLPIMQGVRSLRDVKTVVVLSHWEGVKWPELDMFDVENYLVWAHEVSKGDMKKEFEMGWNKGAVCGPRMGLQYERLSGIPGRCSLVSSTTVIGVSYVILGIVVSNILYWRKKE